MRRILPSEEFAAWFARFLPRIDRREPRTLFQPVVVSDRSNGRIAHLDGLNLSRGWRWSNLAAAFAGPEQRSDVMRDAATRRRAASIDAIAMDYMGEHWLATFALLATESVEAGDQPLRGKPLRRG